MLDQFLRYSLSHDRPIRVILLEEGALVTRTICVLAITPPHFTYRQGKRGKPRQSDMSTLLSAGYARGDDGSLPEGPLE